MEKKEKNKYAILKVLEEAHRPLGSTRIAERLLSKGFDFSERTIRFYLLAMDREGFTENLGKKGRLITERGSEESAKENVINKVGYFTSELDHITCEMDFHITRKTGTLALNYCLIPRDQLEYIYPLVQTVLFTGYGMGELIGLAEEGEKIRDTVIPKKTVGVGSLCCINFNGILLAHGIPTTPKFGGLLEIKNGNPERFVEIICYDGTSLDPLEIFIKSGMTGILNLAQTGSGRICVSFNEIPATGRDRVVELSRLAKKAGLGNIISIGWPGEPLLGIPVREGRVGFITACGLNPIAALEESGYEINHRFLHASADYQTLFHYEDLGNRLFPSNSPPMVPYEKSASL